LRLIKNKIHNCKDKIIIYNRNFLETIINNDRYVQIMAKDSMSVIDWKSSSDC